MMNYEVDMKRIFQLVLVLVLIDLTGCVVTRTKEKAQQQEEKTLSVAEAYIEKQIAQLQFCEAIFKTDLFELSEEEKVIQGRACHFLWNKRPEEVTKNYLNYEESAKKLARALTKSTDKAREAGWIDKATFLSDLSVIKESNYSEMEERCKYLMKDGYLTEKQIDICINSFKNQHLLSPDLEMIR
ncbi:MAG: hypothetical protein QNJ41_12440 [Xenococcaceae cyanobacterium MO_188.B32]|nr:hypothetical protein [Xenococcaceae cyanobacterium MO_188.B32]